MIYIIFYVRRKTELLILFYVPILTLPVVLQVSTGAEPSKPSQYWWNNFHGICGSSNPSINQLVQVRRGPELRVHSVFFSLLHPELRSVYLWLQACSPRSRPSLAFDPTRRESGSPWVGGGGRRTCFYVTFLAFLLFKMIFACYWGELLTRIGINI